MKVLDLRKIDLDDLDVAPINIKILLELNHIQQQKHVVIRTQDYAGAAALRDKELQLLKILEDETGYRFTGYQEDDIIHKLRQLKIKLLLDE